MDLIFSSTLVLLALLTLVGVALTFLIAIAFRLAIKKYEFEEQVRPLLGVVMPNEDKKEDK